MSICLNCGAINNESASICKKCFNPLKTASTDKVNSSNNLTKNIIRNPKTKKYSPINVDITRYLNELGSTSSSIRNVAVTSIVNIGEPAFDQVVKASKNEDPVIRRKTCDIIGLMGNPKGVKPLILLLKDKDRYVRRRAANALIKVNDDTAVRPLINALSDSETKVVNRSVEALRKIGNPKALNSLEATSRKMNEKYESTKNIGKAIRELRKIKNTREQEEINNRMYQISTLGREGSYQELIDILIDANYKNNKFSKRAQEELLKNREASVKPLIENLDNSDPNAHRKIASTLIELDIHQVNDQYVDALIKLITDTDDEISGKTQDKLIKMGEPALDLLIQNLKTSNEDNLLKTTSILIEIGSHDVIELLIDTLYKILINSEDKYCKMAQDQLIKIGEPAVKQLTSKLSRLKTNRSKVTFTLTKINNSESEALIKSLIILLKDEIREHRIRAQKELIKIGEAAVPFLIPELGTSDMNYLILITFTLTEINSLKDVKILTEPLIKILTYWDKKNRAKAKEELIKIGEPAVEPLIKTLNEKPSFGRKEAEEALLKIGNKKGLAKVKEIRNKQEIDDLIKNLDLKNREVSVNSLDKLVMIGKPAVPALIEALDTSNVNIKEGAVLALGRIGMNTGDRRAVKHLIPLMHEDIGLYGQAARNSIVQIGELSVPMLLDALENSYDAEPVDGIFQGDIARALCEIRDPRAVDPLIILLKNTESEFLSKWVSDTMYLLGEPVVEPLIKALEDPNDNLSLSAANALKFIGDPRAVTPLIKLMEDPNRISREEYALTLGYIGDKTSIEPLIKALDDQDDNFANAVASSLVNMGQASVEPLITAIKNSKENPYYHGILMGIGVPAFDSITELLNHQDWEIRNQALLDIVQIDPNKSFWYLITALNDDNETIRKNAAGILGAAADTRAINPLMDTLKDPDVEVRNAAAKALNRIEERKPIPHDEPESNDEINDYPLIPKGEISITDVHRMGREKDIDGLIRALTSEDTNISHLAKIKLVNIGKPALEKLVKAKNDSKNRDYIFYIGDAIDYLKIFNKDVSGEDVDQITEEQGRTTHSKVDKMVKKNDIQGLVNLLRYSDDFSEHDMSILASATVNLGDIGSPAVYPIINFMIDHVGEDLRGPILALINMEQRGVDCLIKLLDHYDDDVVNMSMYTLKVIYQDDPAGLNNILRKKRSSDLDDLDYDFYDDPNTVTLNANELDELISREDFKTSTRRLTNRLIDENDDYMDDIIAGLYGKK